MKNTKNYLLNTWINRLIWSFCITLVTSLSGYSQITRDPCSFVTYYIPPIYAGNSGVQYDNAILQLLTDVEVDVNFRVLNANRIVLTSGVINASNPFKQEIPYVNNENVIEIYDVYTPTRKGGIIIEAEKKVTAILENNSPLSRHLITGKGLWAIGTEFFAASLIRAEFSYEKERHFLSFMALEDNTQVTVYPPASRELEGPNGRTTAPFNVTLNALESYVVLASRVNEPYSISGARVVSDKPITMVSGCRHVNIAGSGSKESSIDQLIPVENLGKEYVLVQTPAVSEQQYGFVVATKDGTQIFEDTNPTPLATINAGEYYEVNKTGVAGTAKRIFTSQPAYVMDVVAPVTGGEVGMALAAPLDQNSGSKNVAFRKTADANSLAIILPDSAISSCMLNGTRADTLAAQRSDIPGKSNYEVLYIENENIANGQNIITCEEKVHVMHISGTSHHGGRGGYYSNFDPINIYCDFGDLPDSYNTLLLSDGPSHRLINTEFDENAKTSTLMLGSRVDDDELPIPGDLATGDDLHQIDDEDGVTLPSIAGCPTSKAISIPVNFVNTSGGNAFLAGWVDVNQDGSFSPSEGQILNVVNGATSQSMTFTLNACVKPPDIAARFRISKDPLTTSSFKGFVNNGEVEDYKITVLPHTLTIDNCPSPITETGGSGCTVAVPDLTTGITASHSCGGSANIVTVTQNPRAGTMLTGPLTRDIQIVATDNCGISATCTVALTVSCMNMSFSVVPPDSNLGCNPNITPATPGDVTVVNSCGTPTITVAENSSTVGCTVKITNTWTARDTCNTTITASQVITYTSDSQAPVFTSVPADENLGFNPTITPATPGDVTVTDNCGIESLTVSSSSTKNGNEVTLVNTWTARDACGNEQVATQTLTYEENGTQPQFITVPPDRTGCNLSITPATIGDVTVGNGCGNKTITLSTTQRTNGCVVTTRNTWTARDECNNAVSAEQVIISTNDTQKPVFTSVPADKDLGFNPTITPATPGDVTVTDNCGIESLTVSSTSTKNGEETTLVNTWTARDACGNEQVATQTLTYRENGTQPQFITVPPDRTGCNLLITPATIGDVTVGNGCGNKTITLSTTQRTNGCVVTTRNTWTARDECNNTVSAEQVIINTIDAQDPVFTSVPADVNLGCNPNYTPASEGDVQVAENCTLVSLSVRTVGRTNGCIITLTNTWTAIDVCGNSATVSQVVVYTNDTTAPVFLSVPVSANLGCNPVIIPATANDVTVTDNCGSSEVTLTSRSSQNGCIVTLVNTWKATDPCGNSSSKSQTLTYTADRTAPAMNCPQDQTIDLGSNCKLQLPSFIPGDLADNCTDRASLNVSQFPPAGTWVEAPIDVNVRLSARDACGNQSGCSFIIRYVCSLDLGNRVWNDCNNNGVMDAGEPGLVNVMVNLLDENGKLQENALTDFDGNYLFDEIPVAIYIVEIERNNFHGGVLSGWYNSTGNTSGEEGKDNGLEEEIDLYSNPPSNLQNAPGIRSTPINLRKSDNLTADFGFYQNGTIGDFVWEDLNHNGIQDPGEPGLGNVSIQLHNTDSGEVKRQTTDAFGNYSFTGLLCANYYLEFSPPAAGYMVSHQDRGGDEADSDMNNAAITINTSLSSGENDQTWDAGFVRYASVGGVVWVDLNKNQDPSDELTSRFGLNNNTLNLSLDGGGAVQMNTVGSLMDGNNLQELSNTTSTNNGSYQFVNLLPGKYMVTLQTNNIPNWLTGSSTHNDYANGVIPTKQIELQSGQQLLDVNFGFFSQTTAIALKRFTAMLHEEGVLLKWETGSEKDNLGFNLYRSLTEESERIPVNAELIPALNVSSGGRYQWLDEQVGEGTWYYWLEDRDYNGKQTLHGPRIVEVGGERGATKLIRLPKKAGLYRIKDEELTKSGLNDYESVTVKINGVKVPLYVNKDRFILFFVPKGAEEVEISLEDFSPRMDSVKMY